MGLNDELRRLPAVDRVAQALDAPTPLATAAARRAVDLAREAVRAGETAPSLERTIEIAEEVLRERDRLTLKPVLNATGVLIHTNLGRVPLGPRQRAAIDAIAGSYSNLEFDLVTGKRGTRYAHCEDAITTLTGAERALVVNNNAAAVLLMLSTLCKDKEVIISRGELVEIGGEFRIPDVMSAAGVDLIEVGTTNRTHLVDYERAIGPHTVAILKVHPSNYRVVGFAHAVPARELARLAKGRGISFLHDLGSGLLRDDPGVLEQEDEPLVVDALREGADVITFSGDKLLGGPQAGIIAGRADLIERLARDPLLRALRVDKLTLAALDATLRAYLEEDTNDLPLWRMTEQSLDELQGRAKTVARKLADGTERDAKFEAIPTRAVTGGGSFADKDMGSWAVAVIDPERTPDEVARTLRFLDPPVIARIEDDRLLLDLRTIAPEDDGRLIELVTEALR